MENESPKKIPVAFQIIDRCHKIADDIKDASEMLQISIPESAERDTEVQTELESKLSGLENHLSSIFQSYKI